MAFPKIPKDAKVLAGNHRQRLQRLAEAPGLAGRCGENVKAAARAMQENTARQLLEQIPVEELNREKRGIRTKLLRDQGYENLAQVLCASVRELEAISGISLEGAREIRSLAEELEKQASEGARIRLSADEKTAEATELLRTLVRNRELPGLTGKCSQLLKLYESPLNTAFRDLEPAKNGFSWLFTGREKKEKALRAYEILSGCETQGFGPEADSLLKQVSEIWYLSEKELWKRFEAQSIRLLGDLEALCPGILGTDREDSFGLPETLAKEIRQVEIRLDGLRCQLRQYQLLGVQYILHQGRVLLGDEMGLGKTVQAIGAMVALRNAGEKHFLVVCPASVLENWCREIRKHSDLPVFRIYGDHREAALGQWMETGGAGVTTYEATAAVQLTEGMELSMLVVDEAHYIKNPEAQRSQRVRGLCAFAQRILFMTGTALENKVEEMLSLIRILDPKIEKEAEKMASLSSAPQFREIIAPVYYRRKREDVLKELPELIETEQWCALGPEETMAYEWAVLNGRFAEARRVSWSIQDLSLSSKARRLQELAEDAREEGRKLVVFSFFLDTISKVCSLMGDRCVEPITGAVTPEHRQEIVDAFNSAAPGAVLPAQIQAGGTGLNIQSASVVVLCEPQLKPSIENQAISRAYRMGQTRNVLVYRLLADDTVDERILEMLYEKQAAFDAYADESVAAEQTEALDRKALSTIMAQEAQRIQQKNQTVTQ